MKSHQTKKFQQAKIRQKQLMENISQSKYTHGKMRYQDKTSTVNATVGEILHAHQQNNIQRKMKLPGFLQRLRTPVFLRLNFTKAKPTRSTNKAPASTNANQNRLLP
jgi:hypothetical protein